MAEINETNNKVILTESAVKQLIGNIKDADSALQTTIRDNIIGTTADQIISSDSANYNFSLNGIKNYIDNLEAGPFGNISDGSQYIASIKQINGKIEATTASAVSTYFVGNVQTHEPANILSTLPTSNKAITEALTSISATWAVDPQVPGEYISGISQQNARISNINLSPFNPYLVTENTLSETTPTQSFKVNVGGATGTTSVLLKHATTETYGVVKLSNEISNNNPNAITSQAVQNYSQPRHIVLQHQRIPQLGKIPSNSATELLENIQSFISYTPVKITLDGENSDITSYEITAHYIQNQSPSFPSITTSPQVESDLYSSSILENSNSPFYHFYNQIDNLINAWEAWGTAQEDTQPTVSENTDYIYFGALKTSIPSGVQTFSELYTTTTAALSAIKNTYPDIKIFNIWHTNEATPHGNNSLSSLIDPTFDSDDYSNIFKPLPSQIVTFANDIKNGVTYEFNNNNINNNSTLIISPFDDTDWVFWREKGVRGYQANNKLFFVSDEGTNKETYANITIFNNPITQEENEG